MGGGGGGGINGGVVVVALSRHFCKDLFRWVGTRKACVWIHSARWEKPVDKHVWREVVVVVVNL